MEFLEALLSYALKAIVLVIVLGPITWIGTRIYLSRRRPPRPHHSAFTGRVLPAAIFSNPREFVAAFFAADSTDESRQAYLVGKWNEAAENLPEGDRISDAVPKYLIEQIHSPRTTALFIAPPPPERGYEDYCAVAIFDLTSFQNNQSFYARYFVLRRLFGWATAICEGHAAGPGACDFKAHGEGPGPDIRKFLAELKGLIRNDRSG